MKSIRVSTAWIVVGLVLVFPLRAGERPLREGPAVRAYRLAAPSVVSISSEKRLSGPNWSGGIVEPQRVNGMGTGVVIDHRGYILTNAHVVDSVERLRVRLLSGTEYPARVVRVDPGHDLAIIKIDTPEPLRPIKLGTSSDLMVGEPVVAIGNAFGYSHTVSTGIISQLHRTVRLNERLTYFDLIQTDASINPGNSGGPLLNMYGEVIGINVAIRAEAQNIGFALPIDQVKQVAARLISAETLAGVSHGLTYVDLSMQAGEDGPRRGVKIMTVPTGGSDLLPGDVVIRVGDIPVNHSIDFERAWLDVVPGTSVPIVVLRDGGEHTVYYEPRVSPAELIWQVLGLRLSQLEPEEVQRYRPELRGGMLVAAVRRESPASRAGIRTGDILVGLHRWETLRYKDILSILKQPEISGRSRFRALVLRAGRTLELWLRDVPAHHLALH